MHHRDEGEKVGVVGHVHGVETGARIGGPIAGVGLHSFTVGLGGVRPAVHTGVNVRGHVDQMAGVEHQLAQAVGGGYAPLGMSRGLDCVNV